MAPQVTCSMTMRCNLSDPQFTDLDNGPNANLKGLLWILEGMTYVTLVSDKVIHKFKVFCCRDTKRHPS